MKTSLMIDNSWGNDELFGSGLNFIQLDQQKGYKQVSDLYFTF